MSIVNEEFIMSNMSREQYQKYYASLESAPKQDQVEPVAPVPQQVQPTSQPSTILQPIAQNLTQEQLLMIEQFSRESRLNMEWSKHCLDHSQWNFEEAAKQFLIHKDKLPKDAFLV